MDSGQELSAGERLVLRPVGRASFSDVTWGPEGTDPADFETMPLPGEPLGAVVGRIGENVFMVGAGFDGTVATSGRLQLSLNLPRGDDLDQLKERQGGFRVSVTHALPPPPPPPPPPDPVGNEVRAEPVPSPTDQTMPQPALPEASGPSAPSGPKRDDDGPLAWILAAALAAAAAMGLGLWQWRRARLSARTKGRLSVAQSLSPDPADGDRPPLELSPAWPTVATRWRVEEQEPAYGGWAGEEVRNG